MNYQRILVVTTVGDDPPVTFETIRRLVPGAEQLIVIAERARPAPARFAPAAPAEVDEASSRAMDQLQKAARSCAPSVDVALTPDLTADALADAASASSIDLVVVGSRHHRTLALAAGLRKRKPLPVLCVGSIPEPRPPGRGNCLGCLALGERARAAMLTFLRERAGPRERVVLLESRPLSSQELAELREVSGIAPQVELLDASGQRWRRLIEARARHEFDLMVLAQFPPLVLLAVGARPPVLILPPFRAPVAEHERTVDIPDSVDDGAQIRLRVEYAAGIGRRTPIEDQELAFVRAGEVVARATALRGEVELPSGTGESLGLFRIHGQAVADPSASVEARVAVVRAGQRPIVLFDAEVADEALSLLRRVSGAEPVAMRVRATRSCASLRNRLRAVGLAPYVLDAGAVLGEGDAPDVPGQADAVRLARAAARMRAAGIPVLGIVYRGPHRPLTRGLLALLPEELPTLEVTPPVGRVAHPSLKERLDATTGTAVIGGNQVQLELDNPTARGWLLSAIEASRARVHFQVYMGLDDDVGRPVEAALAAAAARGVTVRVLVDSLHGGHGSFGEHNPLLDRLSARPGVELRVGKPITGAPTLELLKQRDHRKLVVVDGKLALLGGRNLSHEYYTGFGEVALRPEMTWRMVPWLDAGARVEGPAVANLERAFLQAWTDNGGEPFEIEVPPPAGSTGARVVVHRGLRDAYTLEAYLAMIDGAQSHVYAVNGFPLLLEIQHALLRALRRGVRVRTLVGNLTPRHGEEPFRGPLTTGRIAATSFVHSRLDPLVAAGAECYQLVIAHQPSWASNIGNIRPHVHAKTMSVDGRMCSVGSANLDVTAGYWEDELMLIVEDDTVASALEARLDQLMSGSDRFDRTDPGWLRQAEQRRWMRYWPGVLG